MAKNIGHFWNKNLTLQKFASWNMLKNRNKTDIYENWISSTPIILPRKLQVEQISDEP